MKSVYTFQECLYNGQFFAILLLNRLPFVRCFPCSSSFSDLWNIPWGVLHSESISRYFDLNITPFPPLCHLRWLKIVSSSFQDVDFDGSLLPLFISWCYNYGAKNCPVIGEHVGIIFVTLKLTIATLWPAKNTLNFSFKRVFFKNGTVKFLLIIEFW